MNTQINTPPSSAGERLNDVRESGRAATVKTFRWRIACDGSVSFPQGTRCRLQACVDGGEWVDQHRDLRTRRQCSDMLSRITQGTRKLKLSSSDSERSR